jgi:ceramide synthetase
MDRKITKYSEALWRFIFYTALMLVGYTALFRPTIAPWLLDTHKYWENLPLQPITPTMEFYYLLELGCYLHQLLWTEVKRSDALEMITHHIATLTLIIFSFLANYTRIGLTIMIVHDVADIFLELAKVFNYISNRNPTVHWVRFSAEITFGVFAVVFFLSRLYFYPRYVVSSVIFDAGKTFRMDWFGYWLFLVPLLILQCLHIFWFYLVCKMIYKMLFSTVKVDKDERSDDDGDVGDEYDSDADKKKQ